MYLSRCTKLYRSKLCETDQIKKCFSSIWHIVQDLQSEQLLLTLQKPGTVTKLYNALSLTLVRSSLPHSPTTPPPHLPFKKPDSTRSPSQPSNVKITSQRQSQDSNHLVSTSTTTITQSSSLLDFLRHQATATFLPSAYPSAVAPGYLSYVRWQALHHAAGSTNAVLASTFMLYSIGLGAAAAIPTAGALNWVFKDGLGQLGTLLFGRVIAHRFDVAPRMWYLIASTKLNIAMLLEISTVLMPGYFLPVASAANALKGLAWMSGGSSRSAFNVAFAADANIADITAKATSQTICTSLIGTTLGAGIASAIGQSPEAAVACFFVVAGVHLYSGYKSVRTVPLSTLNATRLEHLIINDYLQTYTDKNSSHNNSRRRMTTPVEMAGIEPIFIHNNKSSSDVRIGTSLELLGSTCPDRVVKAMEVYGREKYLIIQEEGEGVHLVFHVDANVKDCLLGYLNACIIKSGRYVGDDERRIVVRAQEMFDGMYGDMEGAGWDVNKVVLEQVKSDRRARWELVV